MKKIIAALLALVTVFSAASVCLAENTSEFTDINEKSKYYDEIMFLNELGIISGYEDNTFRPDNTVTRAEFTKMAVAALNGEEMIKQKEEEEKISLSKEYSFDDITEHWARLYINHGAENKFISGYPDGTFRPDENVTYVQAQKMLISAIGYETYAKNTGGWPNGYKMWAASMGVTQGMDKIDDDTPLTRAQVAALIYNTMNTPLCVLDGYDITENGEASPRLLIMDGDGVEYRTLLTHYFGIDPDEK